MIKIKVHVIVVKMLLKRLMTWQKPSPAAILTLWLLSLVLSVITTIVTLTAIVSMNNLSLKIMIAMKKMTVAKITWKKWTMTMTKMAMTK